MTHKNGSPHTWWKKAEIEAPFHSVVHEGSDVVLSELALAALVSTGSYTKYLYYEVRGLRPKLVAISNANMA